jgi:hypothetical protein
VFGWGRLGKVGVGAFRIQNLQRTHMKTVHFGMEYTFAFLFISVRSGPSLSVTVSTYYILHRFNKGILLG